MKKGEVMNENKIGGLDFIKERECITIDGRTFQINEHFDNNDFQKGEGEGEFFIKYNALLRVIKKMFIINDYRATVLQVPEKNNEWCATVQVTYELAFENQDTKIGRRFGWSATADCRASNAKNEFTRYTVAMAETRAAARALRNILGIPLCSDEEIGDTTLSFEEPITDNQKNLLQQKFIKDDGIDINKIREIVIPDIDQLTRSQAANLLEKLNKKKRKSKKEG
jgi:hypothetical protein